MAAKARLNSPTRGTAGSSRPAVVGCMERRGDATRWFDDLHGAGLITERSAMSLTKSPASNFGSGSSLRAIMTTGAAALIGTVIGGVSVLGIVMAVILAAVPRSPKRCTGRQRNGCRRRCKPRRRRCKPQYRSRRPRLWRRAKAFLRWRGLARSGLTRSRRGPIITPRPQPKRLRRGKNRRPRTIGPP